MDMKKTLTFLSLSLFLSASFGQDEFKIMLQGEETDISGTVHSELTYTEESHINFDVENVSGATVDVRIERYKVVELAGTEDYLCWGADFLTGTCYPAGTVSPHNPWVTPGDFEMGDGSAGLLSSYHVSHGIEGTVQYRYYIINGDDERLDSVDVEYTFAVGLEEEENVTVSLFPNPATSVVNIELNENIQNVGFSLYNVLGDRVIDRTLNAGMNSINVSALPNGVYFYTIRKEGDVVETKKLVVRH